MTVSGKAMRESVELATIVCSLGDIGDHVVIEAVRGALRERPVRALAAQAALVGAVGQIAEAKLDALLMSPDLLEMAWDRSFEGRPYAAAMFGMTRQELLRDSGLAAARMR